MAISKEQLASIIGGKARSLCSTEGAKITESYVGQQSTNFDDEYDDGFNFDPSIPSLNSGNITYNKERVENSRMPNKIKQSMMENVINTDALSQTSILDTLNVKPTPTVNRNKQKIQETVSYQPQSAVDYTIIKAIVNECLNEYFSKQPLNESASLKTIGLSNGVISLVDNKGNVFKAKLEKIGNKNDK